MWPAISFYTVAIPLLLAAKPPGDTLDINSDSLIVPHHPHFPLRILPLGGSITWGQDSTDGNGYREHLHELLEQRSTIVDMVGTVHSGKMSDNENEGHPGARVDQVALFAKNGIAFKPNLILIKYAGTNDVVREASEYPIDKIGQRMYKLIEYLFNEIPDVTIILSTLILNANAGADERIRKIVNPQYESLVKSLQERQARIMLAGLHSVINAEEMVDGTHPNDKGYEKLAKAWAKAIAEAGRKGILVKPQDPDLTSGTSGNTHKAILATSPVALAPVSKALSTVMPTKAFHTLDVSCSLPMDSEPLEVEVGSRPGCSILGKAPTYVSQTLIPAVPQSNAARSNKPFWSGRNNGAMRASPELQTCQVAMLL
ncbi:GDSL-like lipase acylhydrolase [Paraphaeosphaeria minitans]|uniref:GDSL-like lipase acylhydrolase n=1 Tax=Paraphaeosphaeria minitans TaxID=565426 RepID=A0A9P6GBL4_9PLEO|nr:GDSL-like lipase acylhydrolase [Paraphaeosphaeria minitans]